MLPLPAQTKETTPQPLAIDLFAGVGGLSLGIEAAGFQVALAVEKDPITAAQYQKNFPHAKVLCTDITQLQAQTILEAIKQNHPEWDGKLTAVVGGPCCQGFSRIGKRDPNDKRNHLVSHFIRLVGELRPQIFVMENVCGLRDKRHAPLIDRCYQQLQQLGYTVQEWKLNAKDYGVPQSRTRLFWVGWKDDAGRRGHGDRSRNVSRTLCPEHKPQESLFSPTRLFDSVALFQKGLQFPSEISPRLPISASPRQSQPTTHECTPITPPTPLETKVTVREAIGSIQKGEASEYVHQLHQTFPNPNSQTPNQLTGCTLTNHTPEVIARFAATPPGTIEPISRLYRLDWDGICPTLRAGTGSEHGNHTAARPIHPKQPRVITVREAARLSSFPDWFQFSPTKLHGYRQIGNAVPPLLALAVGERIYQEAGVRGAGCKGEGNTRVPLLPSPFSLASSVQALSNSNQSTIKSSSPGGVIMTTADTTTNLSPSSSSQFDYAIHFSSTELAHKAKCTNSHFIAFARRTFKELVKIGSELWDVYETSCRVLGASKGKKAFESWLASDEFGGSKYLAQVAMALSPWYKNLSLAMQKLVASKVNKWSLSALKLLPTLASDLVEKLVKEGKQTTKSIKCALDASQAKSKLKLGHRATEADWQLVSEKFNITDDSLETLKLEALHSATTNPETGEVVVMTDDITRALQAFGCNLSKVLPRHASSPENHERKEQGSREQGAGGIPSSPLPWNEVEQRSQSTEGLFSKEEVEAQITEAIARYQTEKKEEEIARLVEIRETALAQVQAEIQAIYASRDKHQKAYEQLQEQCSKLQQQLAQTQGLVQENQRLQQRIEDLEKALTSANENRWSNTFSQQAAKVVNKELADCIEPLQQQLEEKTAQVEKLAKQLEKYQKLALPLTDELLFVGARVKVLTSPEGWSGYTGEVVDRQGKGDRDWWVLLDYIHDSGSCTKNLFKAGQLTFELEDCASQTERLTQLEYENRTRGQVDTGRRGILKPTLRVNLNQQLMRAPELAQLDNSILQEFGEAAEVSGISGWSCRGYRSTSGSLFTRFPEALCAFVKDLALNPELHPVF
ncbi:MAG: DNA (cytosine-5-)-methyltransferase [Symploca sp. SIO1C4]|uniref:DNA (cytosine-5-)-methyltransferase n=1 Tax=Symploca sp. SIO1C4 TaxID=2607765 RepID=A0A6B3NAE8_9CYAN|nr:DNA (cytosine-5-)-methyltransferase [Symploca sp. SIO1C4]